jgi:two-component system phosphate regulon response regulator PhoB
MVKKIMIIDDDPDIREIMRFLLREEGYEVIDFADANGIKSIDTFNPDLIILDNYLSDWLSDIDGGQICRSLKSKGEYDHIKIILTSAVSNIENIAVANKADGFLKKPFDINDFTLLVSTY